MRRQLSAEELSALRKKAEDSRKARSEDVRWIVQESLRENWKMALFGLLVIAAGFARVYQMMHRYSPE